MANDNQLKKIKDEATILELLSTTKLENSEVFIWRFVGGSKHMASVRIESIRKIRNDFCIVPVAGQDRQVQEILGSLNTINLYVPDSAMLLQCQIKQTDAPFRYYLQIPQFIAQVERRKSFRLNVHNESDVKLTFMKNMPQPRNVKQHFHKTCFDISSGGFSFFVSKAEAKFFGEKDLMSDVEIKTADWAGKIGAEITSIKEIDPDEKNGLNYKAMRVCCKFVQIDQISKKYLEKYIFERIKKELHAING